MKSNIIYPSESDFELLTSDKSTWFGYNEIERGVIWNNDKVKKFWQVFYEVHKDGNGFYFTDYEFPPILGDGFLNFKTKEIDSPVVFRNCTFWGKVEMKNLIFEEEVSFRDSHFLESVSFVNIKFKNNVGWDFADFNNSSLFNEIDFYEKCFFHKTKLRNTIFANVSFNKEVFFDRSIIKKGTFSNVIFESCMFDRLNKLNNDKYNTYTEAPVLFFNGIDFKSNMKFIRVDLSKTSFFNCDLKDINLKKCSFNYSDNRIVLFDEKKELLDSEEQYRDLKRNFYDKKDWEKSGYFYTSEMKIRTQRLWKEKKYFEWFVYWFYGFFGGYTQNFKRPLTLFLLFSFLFFPAAYFFLETSFFLDEKIQENIFNSLKKSISNSLPIIKTNLDYKNWWLKSFQIVFTGILLTFTILGLRKRFKQ